MMVLVGALEDAKPGDKILLGSYGDGADAFILQVTDQIEKVRDRRGIKKHLATKRMIPEYSTYAQWRGVIEAAAASRRPAQAGPSPSALLREQNEVLRLHGVKCNNCGTVQYPPQRVCTKCRAKDNFQEVRLSDKKASLYTYAMDYIAGTMDVPLVISVINFEGGGRMVGMMTDRNINEIKIGMPLEMSLRCLRYTAGIHNYYWKPIPVRAQ